MREGRSHQAGEPVQHDRVQRLRPSGGYRNLRSFQVTTIIYDATVAFCARFLDRRSRTVDQMPTCPACGESMVLRTARKGALAGSRFWGCAGFPRCKATRPLDLT